MSKPLSKVLVAAAAGVAMAAAPTVTRAQSCQLNCPGNISRNNDTGQCSAVVSYQTVATGNCGAILCWPPTGWAFPVGSTTVDCQATAGPSCSFSVGISDTERPTITCGMHRMTQMTTSASGGIVSFPAPIPGDNCAGAAVTCTPASGSVFPLGYSLVDCHVTDVGGNSAYCVFPVKVLKTQCAGLPGGLVARYPADGTAYDVHGTHDGTLINGATFAPGFIGSAFSFAGDYDAVTTTLDVQPTTMPATTWAAWVYPTTLPKASRQDILCTDDGGYDRCLLVEANTSTVGGFDGKGFSNGAAANLDPLRANQWQHVTLAYWQQGPARWLRVTEDAQWIGSGFPTDATSQASTNKLSIGNSPGFPWEGFSGRIDEVEIYDRVLTEPEFDSLYATQTNAACTFADGFENGFKVWAWARP